MTDDEMDMMPPAIRRGTQRHFFDGPGRADDAAVLAKLEVDYTPAAVAVQLLLALNELAEIGGDPGTVLFAGPTGRSLSRDAIERRITRTAQIAATACPSLNAKNITAHTLRHTAAMRLLHSGVDVTVIALWLGHAQVTTTNIYLHADMALKEAALAKTTPLGSTVRRYKPADNLLAFLESL